MSNRKNPNTLWRIDRDAKQGLVAYNTSLELESLNHVPKKIGDLSLEHSTLYDLRNSSPSDVRQAAHDHYQAHQDEYHDLAVMQAHIEGVEIKVEDPVVIGKKA